MQTDGLGATLALPVYEPVENEAVSFSEALTREGNTLTRRQTFLLKVVEFTPAQYATLKGALRTMEFDERQKAIFAAMQPPADAEVLSDKVEFELTDSHSWTQTSTVRMKVLSYAGKKKNSEVKLAYNPAWEELALEITAPGQAVRLAPGHLLFLLLAEPLGPGLAEGLALLASACPGAIVRIIRYSDRVSLLNDRARRRYLIRRLLSRC